MHTSKVKSTSILAWHFIGKTLRDGKEVPSDGKKLTHHDELRMCESGLHASKNILDALKYAPGCTVCRVRCGGKTIFSNDKLVCSERTILWRMDIEEVLRSFARKQALTVIGNWNAPSVVRKYLETGDDELKSAARLAAISAARLAAISAAESAAESAAWATWAATWAAAWAAAWSADRLAAESAAWAATWAAKSAARLAAWSAAEKMLVGMIEQEKETKDYV